MPRAASPWALSTSSDTRLDGATIFTEAARPKSANCFTNATASGPAKLAKMNWGRASLMAGKYGAKLVVPNGGNDSPSTLPPIASNAFLKWAAVCWPNAKLNAQTWARSPDFAFDHGASGAEDCQPLVEKRKW